MKGALGAKKIKSSNFMKFLLEKRIFKLESNQINHLINIDLIVFNNKTKTQKKKKFFIIIGEFYSSKSALNLRDMLAEKYIKKDLLKK